MSATHSAGRFYLADTLAQRHPNTASALTNALRLSGVEVATLPGTRDIWARDYMPVPTALGSLVQFRYAPDYLRPKRWHRTITDGANVTQQLGLPFKSSPLIVDGGNVVSRFGRVIMTDKVLRENPKVPIAQLLTSLAEALEVNRIDLVPAHPKDFTGHADGLVQILDERTALINDCRRHEPALWATLQTALRRAGFECVPLPYNPYQNPDYTSAIGEYINFLCVSRTLIVPTYQQAEDDAVLRRLQALYPGHNIIPVDGRAIARQGGVFHCVTWSSEVPVHGGA
ncbi:agmatine deiminase family protein [Hymenobacter sp. BT770]|uniref:agmatine deiminase family protein n=1 Tax=Hymenobacter sp. BT770 TaxID=2886942 RepID=UPI001D11AF42|nr:agmatine deiminase family protein [Hymenobacter sp. BT770]MCC3154587.1 agmatine deiminase family protein [Hymenobacter sp. BT770]MDO3416641.1 agmatine deiminase family protein [Hymenobacter sp. BT770]